MLLSKPGPLEIDIFSTEIAPLNIFQTFLKTIRDDVFVFFFRNYALKICIITKITHETTAASKKWFL